MKMIKLTAAVAAASVSVFASAQHASDSGLAGSGSGTGSIQSSVPVAIVAECETLAAMQKVVGLPTACWGNTSKLCAPSISSAELRNLLSNASSTSMVGVGGTLLSASADTDINALCAGTSSTQASGITKRYVADGTLEAIQQFMGSNACGPNAAANVTGQGTVASVQAGLNGNKVPFGFIAATDIDLLDSSVGFIKLDGSAPDLVNHLSANYNLVANITDVAPAVADFASRGTTFGIGLGPYHSQVANGAATACGFLNGSTVDVNGGAL